jgi:hypothetical protein
VIDPIAALLTPEARTRGRNQLIAALELAGVINPVTAADDPTTTAPPVHVWEPKPLDYQDDIRNWGLGTQL